MTTSFLVTPVRAKLVAGKLLFAALLGLMVFFVNVSESREPLAAAGLKYFAVGSNQGRAPIVMLSDLETLEFAQKQIANIEAGTHAFEQFLQLQRFGSVHAGGGLVQRQQF